MARKSSTRPEPAGTTRPTHDDVFASRSPQDPTDDGDSFLSRHPGVALGGAAVATSAAGYGVARAVGYGFNRITRKAIEKTTESGVQQAAASCTKSFFSLFGK